MSGVKVQAPDRLNASFVSNVSKLMFASKASALLSILVGTLVLFGYAFDVTLFKNIDFGGVSMKVNAAIAFIFAGAALWLLVPDKRLKTQHLFGIICALVVLFIGGLTLSEYLFGWDFGIDDIFFTGRMAQGTALSFLCLGLALTLFDVKTHLIQWPTQLLILPVALISLVAILGYLFGDTEVIGISAYTKMAMHTSLLLLALSIGILFARPTCGFMAVASSDALGSQFLRRVVPVVFFVLIFMGGLRLGGERIGLFGTKYGVSIFVTRIFVIFLLVIWNSANNLNRVDKKNKQAEIDLLKKNDDLLVLSERIEVILSSANVGAWSLDLVTDIAWRNLVHDQIFGYPSLLMKWGSEIFLTHVLPEDREMVKQSVEKAFTTGKFAIDCRITRVDNKEVRFISARGKIFFNENAKPIRMLGTTTDITEQKNMEEKIRKDQKFVELVLENVPNMIFVKEASELKFVQFNKAAEELLGYSKTDLIGKNDYDFFPKSEADFFTSTDRSIFEERKLFDIPEESIHTRLKGERILHTKKIPLYDSQGMPEFLLGISEDITELKKLTLERERREALVMSASRINLLLQNALDAVVGMNNQGIITSWNNQSAVIFGWSNEEAVGQKMANLIIPLQYREAHQMGLDKFVSTGIGPILNRRIELTALNRDQMEFPIELTVIPLEADHSWEFYAFIRDISDRKKIEQHQKNLLESENLAKVAAEQSVLMRDEFISIAAHELKTPLTPLSMQLQVISRVLSRESSDELSASIKTDLLKLTQNSREQLDRFSKLIDELLDVTRITAGQLILNLEEANLSTIIQRLLERYQNVISKAGSLIQTQIDPQIQGIFDAERVEQMVENLLTNAIKYGKGKGIEITAKVQGEKAILSVKDHGIGISKEDQQKIFNRFVRAVSVMKFSGLGLGLYINKKIVEAHGGSIRVESEIDQGSTFIVELPFKQTTSS